MLELADVTVREVLAKEPASNISNAELIALIDNEFHNLQGPLKMMFERFKECEETQISMVDDHLNCPCCGVHINLVWDNVK